MKIDQTRFVALLRERFPQVAEAVDECAAGLLHLEMAALGRATIGAIREGDAATIKEHFAFVDEVYRNADAAVKNAVAVSYLEHIDFSGRKAQAVGALALLSPRLRQEVERLNVYWQKIRRSGKL